MNLAISDSGQSIIYSVFSRTFHEIFPMEINIQCFQLSDKIKKNNNNNFGLGLSELIESPNFVGIVGFKTWGKIPMLQCM